MALRRWIDEDAQSTAADDAGRFLFRSFYFAQKIYLTTVAWLVGEATPGGRRLAGARRRQKRQKSCHVWFYPRREF